MKSYESIRAELEPDGSLRDIYIYHANIDVWNNFLGIVSKSKLNCEFWHGDTKKTLPTNIEEIKALQNTDPTTLKIFIEKGIQLNCHFFTEDEIEIDADPKEIGNKQNFDSFVSFLRWLSQGLGKCIHFTHENSPNEEIMVIEHENV